MSRDALGKLAVYGLLVALAAVHASPVVFMVAASLKPDAQVLAGGDSLRAFWPAEASFDNYRDVLRRVDFPRFLFNSILVTGSIVGWGLVVNSMAGYALARLRWRGREAVLTGVLALLVLPVQVIAVPLYFEMMSIGWRDDYKVQIVPFVANAFAIYLFYTAFIGLPRELDEAAWMDGAGPWSTFLRVAVPLSRPTYAAVAVLTFLTFWGYYLWPLMVTSSPDYRPLPVAIAVFRNEATRWGDVMAFGVMMVAPVLLLFLVFQRWFVRGVAAGAIKG
jgi:multiple sugar transport system permease protein